MRTEAADLTNAFEALGIDPIGSTGERADANLRGDHRRVEGPEPGRVHPQAGLRGHARAGAGQRRGAGQLVRDPQAPRDAAALRRAPGAERRAAVLGGPEGPADGEGRQAARGSDRGSSPRVREVRRHDPGGPLRRRRGPDLRRRLVRADRVGRREEGLVQAPRAALSGPGVPLRQDPHRLARVPGQRAGRAVDRVAPPVPADARGGRLEGVRRRRLVVRAQARRHPLPRRDDDRRDEAHHALRPRRDVAVPRHPHDPRAGRPGERRARRRDRRVRRRRGRTRSRRCSSA